MPIPYSSGIVFSLKNSFLLRRCGMLLKRDAEEAPQDMRAARSASAERPPLVVPPLQRGVFPAAVPRLLMFTAAYRPEMPKR